MDLSNCKPGQTIVLASGREVLYLYKLKHYGGWYGKHCVKFEEGGSTYLNNDGTSGTCMYDDPAAEILPQGVRPKWLQLETVNERA